MTFRDGHPLPHNCGPPVTQSQCRNTQHWSEGTMSVPSFLECRVWPNSLPDCLLSKVPGVWRFPTVLRWPYLTLVPWTIESMVGVVTRTVFIVLLLSGWKCLYLSREFTINFTYYFILNFCEEWPCSERELSKEVSNVLPYSFLTQGGGDSVVNCQMTHLKSVDFKTLTYHYNTDGSFS